MKFAVYLVLSACVFCICPRANASGTATIRTFQPAPPQRVTRNVVGWNVHIQTVLLADEPEAVETALRLLEQQLTEIVQTVPAPAVEKLRTVPLYFSPEYPTGGARAEFHPGRQWLIDHGRDPVMAKAVEFTNVMIFEAETVRMPNFALHELAHAYHDLFLPDGFANADLLRAFDTARSSGIYARVMRRHGVGGRVTMEQAYALTNPMEYFAETTEAYFSTNDFFPFDRDELAAHDPQIVELLSRLWGVSPAVGTPAASAPSLVTDPESSKREP